MLFRKTIVWALGVFIAIDFVIISGLLWQIELGNVYLYYIHTGICTLTIHHELSSWWLHGLYLISSVLLLQDFPSMVLISFWVLTKCMEVHFPHFWGGRGKLLGENCYLHVVVLIYICLLLSTLKITCIFRGVCMCIFIYLCQLVKLHQKPRWESLFGLHRIYRPVLFIFRFLWYWSFLPRKLVYFFMCLGLLEYLSVNLLNLFCKGLEHLLLDSPRSFMHFVAIINGIL